MHICEPKFAVQFYNMSLYGWLCHGLSGQCLATVEAVWPVSYNEISCAIGGIVRLWNVGIVSLCGKYTVTESSLFICSHNVISWPGMKWYDLDSHRQCNQGKNEVVNSIIPHCWQMSFSIQPHLPSTDTQMFSKRFNYQIKFYLELLLLLQTGSVHQVIHGEHGSKALAYPQETISS